MERERESKVEQGDSRLSEEDEEEEGTGGFLQACINLLSVQPF